MTDNGNQSVHESRAEDLLSITFMEGPRYRHLYVYTVYACIAWYMQINVHTGACMHAYMYASYRHTVHTECIHTSARWNGTKRTILVMVRARDVRESSLTTREVFALEYLSYESGRDLQVTSPPSLFVQF